MAQCPAAWGTHPSTPGSWPAEIVEYSSPEETAVHPENPNETMTEEQEQFVRDDDEHAEIAALAEGRTSPPTDTRDEPHSTPDA